MFVTGSIVALVTPMMEDQSIDYNALKHLIEWHIEAGTRGFVILGTTGEAATISIPEQDEIIKFAKNLINKRATLIIGCGSNCTQQTIARTNEVAKLGVDACMIVTPYYNKPTQQGLFLHFSEVAKNCNVPIIAYNVPSRTGCDLLPETVAKLADFENIIGIKDATGDLIRIKALKALTGDRFMLYSGDDATAMDFVLEGGHGVISVIANCVPELMNRMMSACLMHDSDAAKLINRTLCDLQDASMIESNPIPIKWLLSHIKGLSDTVRMPLTKLTSVYYPMLLSAYESACIEEPRNITVEKI